MPNGVENDIDDKLKRSLNFAVRFDRPTQPPLYVRDSRFLLRGFRRPVPGIPNKGQRHQKHGKMRMSMRGRAFATVLTALCALMLPFYDAQTRALCRFSTFSPPAGYYLAQVSGITSTGVIVGQLESTRFGDVAFVRYPDGSFTMYKAPNSDSTWFSKRNQGGVIVGAYQDNQYNSRVHGLALHGSRFVAVDYPHAIDTWLSGIDKQGT